MRSHLPHFLPKIFYSDGHRVAEISWFDWAVPLKRGNQNWNIFFLHIGEGNHSICCCCLPLQKQKKKKRKKRAGQLKWEILSATEQSDGEELWNAREKKFNSCIFFPPFLRRRKARKKIPLDDSPEAEQIWFLIDCHDVRHRPAIFFLVFFFLIIFSSSLKEISDLNFPRLAIFWFDTRLPFYGCPLSVI